MSKQITLPVLAGLLAATLVLAGCRDSVSPPRSDPGAPLFSFSPNGIQFTTVAGSLSGRGRTFAKGFDPQNPHLGDAIIVTVYWLGSTIHVDSVVDFVASNPPTPVGNTYHLVDSISAGGFSMATFIATNVRNFPDRSSTPGEILAVRVHLSDSVSDGGVKMSAFSGVEDVFDRALGEFRSDSGSDNTTTVAHAGPISVGAGSLAYTVTMSGLFFLIGPEGFTSLGQGTNDSIKEEAAFAIPTSAATLDPGWTWFFGPERSAWLVTTLALNPAPPPATHLTFTVQPTNTTAGSTISPAVQVAAQDDAGNTVTTFSGAITIALGNNPGDGILSGTETATPVNGVATFSNLSIDKVGTGYTLVATATGLTGATSAPFNITPRPATHLTFTVQPSNTTVGTTISPAVRVAAQDDAGNTVATFSGAITIALGANPGGGTLSGTRTVTPVNGVATFSNLSIDRVANGYTLVATATGLTGATSAPFNITAPPQARVQVSGGGRIDPTIGKTTFGFDVDARSGPPFKGEMQVVYHGGTSRMTRIHSLLIDGVTSSLDARGGVCITWTGNARVNNSDQRRFTATACDNGQPGSNHGDGPDRFGIMVQGSVSTGLTDLKGGNSQARQ